MKKDPTYDQYRLKVIDARSMGFLPEEIAAELQLEIRGIRNKLTAKLIQLSQNPTPYPAREAKRAATECIAVIERICKELLTKEEISA